MVNEYEDIIQPPEQFRDAYKPIPSPRIGKWKNVKPKLVPRKSVKEMVDEYESLIIVIPPPEQFRDKYRLIPKPRTDRPLQIRENQNARRPSKPQRSPPPKKECEDPIIAPLQFRDDKPLQEPVPAPTIKSRAPKIEKLDQALKGHTASYTIEIKDNLDPMNHLTKTKEVVESHLKDLFKTMKGFKFIITLEVTFEKNTFDSKTGKREFIHKTAYFNSKVKTITNANEIESELYTSQQEILSILEVWISEGSGWTIDTVDNNYINVVNYKPLNGSSYIELPTELKNSAKGLTNIKNKDDECFRWCHIRHLNPQSKDPQRIKKPNEQYIDNLDYSNIIFPVSQKQCNKIEKQNRI